jgi:L-lysine exporter family protein LysE/ArgO
VLQIFVQGLILGLAYVVPVGMQNLFVINSALTGRRTRAWVTAALVVFFDMTLALACFLGIGVLMQNVPMAKLVILLVGSLIVMYIGVALIRNAKNAPEAQDVDVPLRKVALSAFVVTWGNVQAIIDGTMLLGASRATMSDAEGWVFVAAVMCASALWFFGITLVLQVFGHRFSPRHVRWVNTVCGAVIIAYGARLFVQFILLVAS